MTESAPTKAKQGGNNGEHRALKPVQSMTMMTDHTHGAVQTAESVDMHSADGQHHVLNTYDITADWWGRLTKHVSEQTGALFRVSIDPQS